MQSHIVDRGGERTGRGRFGGKDKEMVLCHVEWARTHRMLLNPSLPLLAIGKSGERESQVQVAAAEMSSGVPPLPLCRQEPYLYLGIWGGGGKAELGSSVRS